MAFAFFRDRRYDTQLKIELEFELQHLPKPSKKGKTVDRYFLDMIAYVRRFCDRKIAFLPKFERVHGVAFSPGYKRRYLAKCFDSLAEDLQKILLEYLEIDFIFFVQRAADQHEKDGKSSLDEFWEELEQKLLHKTRRLLRQWYEEPLNSCLQVIIHEGEMDEKRQKELRRLHEKNVRGLWLRSERIIRRFCRHKDPRSSKRCFQQILRDREERLPVLKAQLKEQGFRID